MDNLDNRGEMYGSVREHRKRGIAIADHHAAFQSDLMEDQKTLDYLSFSFAIVPKAWQKLPTAIK
jgi:hypothetical protein